MGRSPLGRCAVPSPTGSRACGRRHFYGPLPLVAADCQVRQALGCGAGTTGDDANLDRAVWLRNRHTLLRQILQVQIDRFARFLDGIRNGSAGGRTAENIGHDHAVEMRIVSLLDLDPELQPARAERAVTS